MKAELYIQVELIHPNPDGSVTYRMGWYQEEELKKLPQGWLVETKYSNTVMIRTEEGLKQYEP